LQFNSSIFTETSEV